MSWLLTSLSTRLVRPYCAVVTMFSQCSATPFAVEPVDVVDAMGNQRCYPDFMTRFVDADPKYICGRIGVELDAQKMAAGPLSVVIGQMTVVIGQMNVI